MALAPTPPVRALVVDDTVVVRRLVAGVLDAADDVEVVGTASDGHQALQRIEQLNPDVVTLDVEMPGLDGLATLDQLRRRWPDLPVIMFSTLTERGATATLDALAKGANDYVTKPSNTGSREEAMGVVRDTLLPLVRAWGQRNQRRLRPSAPKPAVAAPVAPAALRPSGRPSPVDVVVVGVSTGGPNALAEVLPALPASLPVPVVVVQHMPPVFTRMLAERLDAQCALTVVEAAEGDVVRRGHVYIAPGGSHLVPVRRGTQVVLTLSDAEPENSCRPAVDVTFRAAASVWGSGVLAVVLTGMGKDGLQGCEVVLGQGGRVLAQDEETSVVWGMPGFVARAGFADEVLPLDQVAEAVTRRATAARAAAGSLSGVAGAVPAGAAGVRPAGAGVPAVHLGGAR
ncbi:MAG: chemotaxis-specific protein-glutamate methyltransferase CheB [Motilibacteraceae bacterium]